MSAAKSSGPDRLGVARVDGEETTVAAYGERIVSVAQLLGDDAPGSTRELIASWPRLAPRLANSSSAPSVDQGSLVWEPPVMPGKLLCVGANYRDHIAEMVRAGGPNIGPTPFPFSFLKPGSALVGDGVEVAFPSYGQKLDWEAELAVVIGDPASAEHDPLAAVFGYTILNDLSLRDFVGPFPHPLGLDAVISKGFDGAAPMGRWITLADRVGEPTGMSVQLHVNGEQMQESSTDEMIFSVAELVSYYARVLSLEPGDVIATGTPAGVGAGKQPPRFLAPGDEIEIEIERLGTLRTPIATAQRSVALAIT
jgi:2-keto-4-pentenoate hydratase/2-oxohepta-3-ene-1,7-dioic acid hydratase in catechol pathway